MSNNQSSRGPISRRQFVGSAAVAAAAGAVTPARAMGAPAFLRKLPNSNFGGVPVGIIAPYAFRGEASSTDEILKRTVELGLGHVEMQSSAFESWAGVPESPPRGSRSEELTAEQQAARQAARAAHAEDVKKWRLAYPVDRYRALRDQYNDAGVAIDVVKFGFGPDMSDEENDYAFRAARALGAVGITSEPPLSFTEHLGSFGDRYRMMLGYHNHTQATDVEHFCRPGAWEQAFFYSKFNSANVDLGHFTAGNSYPPTAFIEKYHDRITNVHLKDCKINDGPNTPWGQGDTPIAEILQLMKREKYPFMATIELEYEIPAGSSVMAELAKCVDYCKNALA